MPKVIEYTRGNLLDSHAEALVNPTNTAGVMGAGLALQFRRKHPEMYADYRRAYADGDLVMGRVWVTTVRYGAGYEPEFKWIICFHTKRHWTDRSNIHDIRDGLIDLRSLLLEDDCQSIIRSIAIPPLGCGLGGLKWKDVKPLIEQHLGDLTCRVIVYEPELPA